MTILVVTKPEPIVSWEEAQRHLRLDGDDEKTYVEALVAAATAWVDGPAGWLGQCLGPQLLEYNGLIDCAQSALPYGPVLEIESISADVRSASPVLVDPIFYELAPDGALVVALGASWVTLPDHRVRYWAGYGKRDPSDATKWIADVPAPVKQAVLLILGQWFRTRSAVNIGNIVNEMPFGVKALLSPYRIWS